MGNRKRSMGRVPIYEAGRDRPVGHVSGDVFRVQLSGSRNLLRRRPVIAFQRRTLEDAQRMDATTVVVTDKSTGRSYRSTIFSLFANGKHWELGYDKRIALHLSLWDEVEDSPDQLALW